MQKERPVFERAMMSSVQIEDQSKEKSNDNDLNFESFR